MDNQISVATAAASSSVSALLDPAGLGPVPAVPLVPEAVLRKHHVHVPTDSRFRAAARLLQALYREDRELPAGRFVDRRGKRRKLGSAIARATGLIGANFLTPAIAEVVHRELLFREIGAMYDVERLRNNLLSSMPLAFNLFGLLKRDLTLATAFMHELIPGFLHEVTAVKFEHSPGRGRAAYTGDHSAFDVFVQGITRQGSRAFAAFEVKYSEGMQETMPPRLSDRVTEIALGSGLFADVEMSGLYRNPLQQLFREHCLAQCILDRDLADVGLFILVGPKDNHLVQQAAQRYSSFLSGPRQGQVHFLNLTLERVIEVYAAIRMETFARMVHRRYADFWLLEGELSLDLPPDPTDEPNAAVVDLKAAA